MALFRKRVQSSPDWRIESAGTWSLEGQPVASNSHIVLAQRGIDIHDHRSRTVNRELLEQFNLILTMEAGHKEALQVEFPQFGERIHLLSEMVGGSYEILDPMGGSVDDFELTARELEKIFEQGYQNIVQLAGI